MDREEIRYLLGSTIYARAKAYENRVQDLECETAENGVRHLSADVRGSGRNLYRTQAWLATNIAGSLFLSRKPYRTMPIPHKSAPSATPTSGKKQNVYCIASFVQRTFGTGILEYMENAIPKE